MQKFDMLVIGSGPGGQRAAVQAAKLGKAVALIEKARDLGGVSINTGTLPSKTLREAVVDLSGSRERQLYGMVYRDNTV
ncbi:MAG: FAD-dependent oxidoreductase, partial [Clostridia bacterium]|nr:FAD-dependent oxidoreductase [Deltaproteobacteria bacterium]